MTVGINNESDVSVNEAALLALARFVMRTLRIHPQAELSLVLVNEPAMADLHSQWMGEEGVTDVLSFPMDELRPGQSGAESVSGILGDIVVCPQVAARQADAAGHGLLDEVLVLVTHGILHLLGFDHATPSEEAEMFGLQRELLSNFFDSDDWCDLGAVDSGI